MYRQFTDAVRRLRSWSAANKDRWPLKWGQRILASTIMIASLWFIGRRLQSDYLSLLGHDLRLTPLRLVASWLCVTGSTALGAWEWALLVDALGGELDTIRGMQIHLLSGLTKYLPGGIWSYAGKVYLATEQGIPAPVAMASVAGEFSIVFLGGLLILALSLPYSAVRPWSPSWRLTLQIVAVLSSLAVTAAFWLIAPRLLSLAFLIPEERINHRKIAVVIIAVVLTWVLLSLGFSILFPSTLVSGPLSIPHRMLALSSAMLAGQVAFLVPMGLGVREAMLIGLLDAWYSPGFIVLVALAFRMETIVGEILSAAVASGLARWFRGQDNSNGLLT